MRAKNTAAAACLKLGSRSAPAEWSERPAEWSERLTPGQSGWLGAAAVGSIPALANAPPCMFGSLRLSGGASAARGCESKFKVVFTAPSGICWLGPVAAASCHHLTPADSG